MSSIEVRIWVSVLCAACLAEACGFSPRPKGNGGGAGASGSQGVVLGAGVSGSLGASGMAAQTQTGAGGLTIPTGGPPSVGIAGSSVAASGHGAGLGTSGMASTTTAGRSGNATGGTQSGGAGIGAAGNSAAGSGAVSSSGARGFPDAWPWVSWYGDSGGASTVSKVAMMFRVINIDVDPDGGNFTDAEIQSLRANGQNRVLSYLNLGSCEMFRSYYSSAPSGFKSCQSSGALTTAYDGYPDEMWANLSNTDYQNLMVNYVAARLAARGIDGFYLDNLEVVEHGANNSNGPCDSQCSQGGLDLVWQLRQKFPDKLIVMQNASSDVTRKGMSHGVAFPSLLDGLSHEEVYSNGGDSGALAEMKAWRDMMLTVNGQPFWLAVEEYVGACSPSNKSAADAIYASAKADGFNAYVTDASGEQSAPCFW